MINAVSSEQTYADVRNGHDRTDEVDFLRLLTSQLQHQDPLNPVDEREFLTQMAQFSMVNDIRELRDLLQDPGWDVATLIGKEVTVQTQAGSLRGQVSSVLLKDTPQVVVDQEAYPAQSVVEVHKSHG